jgi:hypothetical protein
MTKLQSGHAATMLQQLIAEVDNKNVVYSDDLSTQNKEQILQGLVACSEHDVLFENWHSKQIISVASIKSQLKKFLSCSGEQPSSAKRL